MGLNKKPKVVRSGKKRTIPFRRAFFTAPSVWLMFAFFRFWIGIKNKYFSIVQGDLDARWPDISISAHHNRDMLACTATAARVETNREWKFAKRWVLIQFILDFICWFSVLIDINAPNAIKSRISVHCLLIDITAAIYSIYQLAVLPLHFEVTYDY